MKKLLALSLAMAWVLGPSAANAFVINSNTAINTEFTVGYSLATDATDPNGNTNLTGQDLTATVLFKLLDFNSTADFISLELTVTNTTAANDDSVGLQSVAFGVDPNVTGVTFVDAADGEFISATLDVSNEIANSVKPLTLDVQSDTGNGAPNLLLAGEFDTFILNLTIGGLEDLVGATFTPFSSKWQTDPASFQIPGDETGGGPGVPVPAPLALLGFGGLLLGWTTRKQRRHP